MLLAILLLTSLSPALAQVYVDQERPADWEERDLLRLTVFRTGEGDCMLLQAGDEYMMIDGGPYKYREKLKNALEERGISHFRYIFNTHPHDDHVEGLRMLLYYGFTTDEFISVFPLNYSFTYQKKGSGADQEIGRCLPSAGKRGNHRVRRGNADLLYLAGRQDHQRQIRHGEAAVQGQLRPPVC